MSDVGDPTGAQLSAEVGNLDPNARRVLGALAVLGRAPVSVATLGEVAQVGDVRSGLEQLDRQRLIVREPGDRVSVTPGVQVRLKSLLATDDEIDAVLRGLTRRAEDGRLAAGDIDAVDEASRIAAETGRWPQVLRLAQASEATLAATQRVDVWTRIVERRLEAARALGDQGAVAHAQRELDNLAAMDAPTRVVTTTEERDEQPPPDRAGVAWPLVLLVGLALAAAGTGLGYLLGSETSDATTVTETSQAETSVETETATGPTTTLTTTQTETTTETETQTVTEVQTVTETVPGR
jgi:hypothetical protein